jgi:UDP-N-acetylmuramyl pentapeptide synthase
LWIDMADIKEVLSDIHPPKWRWVILKWVNESIIIDGSYNGWFTSISSWILYLNSLEWDVNKILVLWDMRELWQESKNLHLSLADLINATEIKYVILVWEEMKKYAFPEIYEKFWDNTFSFLDSRLAWKKTREIIQQNEKKSVIFVKWSQNTIYLEEWIKEFLFDLRDVNKLCRQSDYWMKKKYEFFTDILGENNNGYTE